MAQRIVGDHNALALYIPSLNNPKSSAPWTASSTARLRRAVWWRPKPERGGDLSSGEGRQLGDDGSQADDYWTVSGLAKPL